VRGAAQKLYYQLAAAVEAVPEGMAEVVEVRGRGRQIVRAWEWPRAQEATEVMKEEKEGKEGKEEEERSKEESLCLYGLAVGFLRVYTMGRSCTWQIELYGIPSY
jgi:hypothetical protein